MDAEAQRLLQDFATNLNRTVPQPELAEWPRLYEFIMHVTRRQAPSAEAVGHALVQAGLDWEEIEPYVIFYEHAVELLRRAQERAVITGAPPASRTTKKRAPVLRRRNR
jgi:hypothetical protein